jgi:hypothetical protein
MPNPQKHVTGKRTKGSLRTDSSAGPAFVRSARGRHTDASLVTVFGQLLGRDGQPAPGVGVSLHANDAAQPLASSTTTSTGLFILRYPAAVVTTSLAKVDKPTAMILRLSTQHQLVQIQAPLTPGIFGPIRIVAHKVLPRGHVAVAPRPFALLDERTLAKLLPTAPDLFLGGDAAERAPGCGSLDPPNLANRSFRYSQLLRVRSPGSPDVDPGTELVMPMEQADTIRVGYGLLITYRQDWWDLGRSLGDLLYTLPLAPGEETKIATVDWRRTDLAQRQTSLDEAVRQDTAIQRIDAVDDVVQLSSTKDGKQTTDAHYASGGGGLSFNILGVGVSGSGSAGTAHTVSTAHEVTDATTSNNETINDRIHQASNTIRSTRSMAIAEVQQSEAASSATRVVRNHNHCHTLTIEYYQVLSHYLLKSSPEAAQAVLLVPYPPPPITGSWIQAHAPALLATLKEPALAGELRALLPGQAVAVTNTADGSSAPVPAPAPPQPGVVAATSTGKITVTYSLTHGTASTLGGLGGGPIGGPMIDLGRAGQGRVQATTTGSAANGEQYVYVGNLPAFDYADVDHVVLNFGIQGEVSNLEVDCENLGGGLTSLVRRAKAEFVAGQTNAFDALPRPAANSGRRGAPATPDVEQFLSPALIAHVLDNAMYYAVAVLLASDDSWLSQLLRAVGLDDVVDPVILGFQGGRLALPLLDLGPLAHAHPEVLADGQIALSSAVDASVITLPTPGIIAEARLGECPACEKVDETVFWDWMKSPIPEDAPGITAAMLASRAQDDTLLATAQTSNLTPPAVQIPTQPTPPIQVGDATMSELVKNLSFSDANEALSFLQGIAGAETAWSGQTVQMSQSGSGSRTGSGQGSPPSGSTGVDSPDPAASGVLDDATAGAGDLLPTEAVDASAAAIAV